MKDAVRILFEKTGRARYISHLDLQHTIQRSFARAGIAVRHSNGFNPHPQMTIALPLPLRCESLCEIMDFVPESSVGIGDVVDAMNGKLPEGIRFLEAYAPSRKVTEIRWIRTEGFWKYEREAPLEELRELFGRKSVPVEKKTKRGTALIDLAEAARGITFEAAESGIRLEAMLSAQEPTVNPELLIRAAAVYLPELPGPSAALFRRVELYDAEGAVFR